MSIRSKLLITYLVLTTLGLAVLGGLDLWAYQTSFRQWAQADLAARTTALADSVADALAGKNAADLTALVRTNGQQEGVKVRVFDPEGHLLSSSAPEQDRALADWRAVPGVAEALRGEPASGVARGVFARGDVLYHARPIRRKGRLLGILRMSLTLDLFEQQFRERLRTVLAAVAVTFMLCALASVGLARSMAEPIRAMRDFALRIGSGQFNTKLRVSRCDELGQLAAELARMSERLNSLDVERRAFLASVSHELRTPVSNVLVTLEALESGADEEPELRLRLTCGAHAEMRRLFKLIQDLLELGRLEAGATELQLRPVSLSGVVRRAVEALECRLRDRNLQASVQVPDIRLLADPERLTQVLMNVLDNAIRYSPPGSTIRISTEADGGLCRLQVRDQGVGIAREDLPRIFDRFFVADPARAGSGAGLGLAIARRIVQAHGGQIEASAEGPGATVTITLPMLDVE